ncbi:MAG: SPOR domain-containing protein [Nannocystaceae bacterium]
MPRFAPEVEASGFAREVAAILSFFLASGKLAVVLGLLPPESPMREMHKWKDKVEFSLDNRQIFFLFFGLSVVGCFVFALGLMTGRRVDWDAKTEVSALTDDSLDLLASELGSEHAPFTFPSGLRASTASQLASTRDPSIAPRDAETLEAEANVKPASATPSKSKRGPADKGSATRKGAGGKGAANKRGVNKKPTASRVAAARSGATTDKKSKKKAATAKTSKVTKKLLASGNKSAAEQGAAKAFRGTKRFTLQMKAFSRRAEADKFVVKLRRNGHDIRIEEHEVRGRKWYRVRLGSFTNWDEALAAKNDFESAEHVIAYVVSQ